MSEATFDVAPTTPRKRPLEEDAASETIEVSRSVSVRGEAIRDGSPAPSTSSSLTELTGSVDPGSAVKSTSSPAVKSAPTKKRKLGLFEAQAEKAAKQREKDEKARQKADEKARKEEEKARKDDEKRKAAEDKENARRARDLEKAEKQKAKDEEKQKKDHEKALKEAEKAQKEAEKRAKEAEKEAEKQRKEAEKLRKERVSSHITIINLRTDNMSSHKCDWDLSSSSQRLKTHHQALQIMSQRVLLADDLQSLVSIWRSPTFRLSSITILLTPSMRSTSYHFIFLNTRMWPQSTDISVVES